MYIFFLIIFFGLIIYLIYLGTTQKFFNQNNRIKITYTIVCMFVCIILFFVSIPKSMRVDNSPNSSSKSKHVDTFDKVKLGMSQDEVIRILGKDPSFRNDQLLTFDNNNLNFVDGKLVGGSPKSIQEQTDSEIRKDKENKKNKSDSDKSMAQIIGNKPVETIQKYPSVYKSYSYDGGMRYLYKNGDNDFLVRFDSNDGMTKVYSYNGSGDDVGPLLYEGRTIINETKTKVIYTN